MIEEYKGNIISFFGKTGTGKSSTLNALFDLNLETDNVKACTKELNFSEVKINNKNYLVVDIPGIGESIDADEIYFSSYIKAISYSSHIVWIIQADTRVYRPDQVAINKLKQYFKPDVKFIFSLNRIDQVGLSDWDINLNIPSVNQLGIIDEKIADIYKKFSKYITLDTKNFVYYSAIKKYNLNKIIEQII